MTIKHSGCANCGRTTVSECNDFGCGFLESGNGEPESKPDTSPKRDNYKSQADYDKAYDLWSENQQ